VVIVQDLAHAGEMGICDVPNPGRSITQDLGNGDMLPACISDRLLDTCDYVLGRPKTQT
jgi:hypothetical protein